MRPGLPAKATHDYVRHGTTTPFASLEVATARVTDACATHNHPDVKAWLDKNLRSTLHFTPTSGSWLNMVETFFGIITRQPPAGEPLPASRT